MEEIHRECDGTGIVLSFIQAIFRTALCFMDTNSFVTILLRLVKHQILIQPKTLLPPKIFSISSSFSQNLAKSYAGVPPEGWRPSYCAVPFVYLSLQADEQESGEIPPNWTENQCESACGTSASWLNRKSVHPWKMLFKGEVRISRCHSFRDFLTIHVFYCFCLLNKLFNFTWKTSSLGVFIVRVRK